ncbi:MAG: hypothetical protein ACR2PT_18850 [Endozoicomonas sp.]
MLLFIFYYCDNAALFIIDCHGISCSWLFGRKWQDNVTSGALPGKRQGVLEASRYRIALYFIWKKL